MAECSRRGRGSNLICPKCVCFFVASLQNSSKILLMPVLNHLRAEGLVLPTNKSKHCGFIKSRAPAS